MGPIHVLIQRRLRVWIRDRHAQPGLAQEGTHMSDFHTAASCSPTRAMRLSGTDAHIAGLGGMAERMNRFPEIFKKSSREDLATRSPTRHHTLGRATRRRAAQVMPINGDLRRHGGLD